MPRTRVLPLTPLFAHVLQCIRDWNYRQCRTRVAPPVVYVHVLCMLINNKWQICCFETAQSCKSGKVSCLYAGTFFLCRGGHCQCLKVHQEEGGDFSSSLWSYMVCYLIIYRSFLLGKVLKVLCLEFSGDDENLPKTAIKYETQLAFPSVLVA